MRITDQHLEIKIAGLVREENVQIPWERVATRDYQTYFAIYDSINASKTNRTYNYLSDWNTAVIYGVVCSIARYKQQ